jgi:hypothetical protein
MHFHPHGVQSIGDALTVLANKEYFIDRRATLVTSLLATAPLPRVTSNAA